MGFCNKYGDLIVVRADGGFCSQIAFVALGMQLMDKGYRVKFDLSWYRANGKDLTGRFARNWDFPKAFPSIPVEEATDDEIKFLRRHHSRVGEMVESWTPPLYVGGYPDCDSSMWAQLTKLKNCFCPRLDAESSAVLEKIGKGSACAIHVRRGDLSNGNQYYGGATSIAYFKRAMAIVMGMDSDVTFYFFSDEPDWVRQNLMPEIDGGRAVVVDANGSDSGYVDCYLMSRCDYVIASIGSLGVMAGVLSPHNRLLIMSNYRDWVSANVPNVCYLNDDCGRRAIAVRNELMLRVPESRLHGIRELGFRLWMSIGGIFVAK